MPTIPSGKKMFIKDVDDSGNINVLYPKTLSDAVFTPDGVPISDILPDEKIDISEYLSKTNTTSYTPSGDYNPATKKYVDDAARDMNGTISTIFMIMIRKESGTYKSDKTYNDINAAFTAGKNIILVFYGDLNGGTSTNYENIFDSIEKTSSSFIFTKQVTTETGYSEKKLTITSTNTVSFSQTSQTTGSRDSICPIKQLVINGSDNTKGTVQTPTDFDTPGDGILYFTTGNTKNFLHMQSIDTVNHTYTFFGVDKTTDEHMVVIVTSSGSATIRRTSITDEPDIIVSTTKPDKSCIWFNIDA